MLKITLPRRCLIPRFWKVPRIELPLARVRVDFPGAVPPPWQEIEVERVTFARLKDDYFIFRVIFG